MFDYSVVRSNKIRAVRITVHPTGEVKVTAPALVPRFLIERFVEKKSSWIREKLEHFKKHPVSPERQFLSKLGRKDFTDQKSRALELVSLKLREFNEHYKLEYHKISIRNQRSRWGSCSHRGNLSFNFKIVYLASAIQDYIIVHELCHIREMNHSKRFWDLVAEQIPDWRGLRRELKGM